MCLDLLFYYIRVRIFLFNVLGSSILLCICLDLLFLCVCIFYFYVFGSLKLETSTFLGLIRDSFIRIVFQSSSSMKCGHIRQAAS